MLHRKKILKGTSVTDNPKLKEDKILSDGNRRLYLDYYYGRIDGKVKRVRKCLNLTIIAHPHLTPKERRQNKMNYEEGRRLRYEAEIKFKNQRYGTRLKSDLSSGFIEYYGQYVESYSKKDIRVVKMAFQWFNDFLRNNLKYSRLEGRLEFRQVDREMCASFAEYARKRSHTGEGANTVYARFKKFINYAVEQEAMDRNPCQGVRVAYSPSPLKATLSYEEEQLLQKTPYAGNPEIRRAFIFSLYTGIRFCDMKELRFCNVDYSNRRLSFVQLKTKEKSANAAVVMPLSDDLLNFIGEAPADKESHIFTLPSYQTCLKELKKWVKSAGIEKKITWHCARHSFATNLLATGRDIKTVASLLGHSGLQCVQRYTRAIDSLKRAAIESLPPIYTEALIPNSRS